ncbi:hypothetical protein E1A91_D04G031900v1 [Gossypium mustelinum]|uniref:Uncharacterized protein n=1 Tax=Gossypium mustelinum TaxID=34275 RepID=A0A5D2V9C0_GOSMU|nr:hypothetical protein E1A91_D04G031900v1 [Gossypium mustelinum]
MHRRDRLGRWPSLRIGATLSPVSDPVQRPSLLGLNTERKNLLAPPLEPISATERAPTTRPKAPQALRGVRRMEERGMRGGWRGAEACEVEWLRTWGHGASGQVGGRFAGMGPGRFWALHFL